MLKIAAGTHPQYLALQADGPPALVPSDPGVLHIDSFAKYAVAFFKISRSILTRASSALSRASSICSALTGLAPAPASLPWAARRTQLPSVGAGTPRILAVTALACPPCTRRTASSLNSSVYAALLPFSVIISHLLYRQLYTRLRSTFFRGNLRALVVCAWTIHGSGRKYRENTSRRGEKRWPNSYLRPLKST